MSLSDSADIQAIAQEMSALLEARIGDLLGSVKAAREVTQQLLDVDGEMDRSGAARRRVEALLESLDDDESSAEAADLRRKLDQIESRHTKLEGRYGELMQRLEVLKGRLDA